MQLDNVAGYVGEECSPKTLASACGPMSIKDRLEIRKRDLETQLKRVNDALDALNANPEVMKVLELVSKV